MLSESQHVRNDAGRKQSRPKQTSDCTVRALSITTNTSYDVAYDFLKGRGRKSSKGFFFPNRCVDDYALGHRFIWKPFPLVKSKKRMSPERFIEEFSEGVYICKTVRHVYAVVDGVINDMFVVDWYEGRCVYGCWEVVKSSDEIE